MTNSKTTKRALLSSVMAVLICFTMLLGTTFAWFTDCAASDSNVITAGNLDIKVQYTLGDKEADGNFVWKDLDGARDLFQKGLWEPGHTEVVVLKIENTGSLALKYAANMNIVDEIVGKTKDGADIVLSDILTVSTCTQQYTDGNGNIASGADIFPEMAFNGEGGVDGWIGYQTTATFKAGNVLKSEKQLQPKESDYIAVKVDMAETVGNAANHNGTEVPTIYFGINVLATQYTAENDSFGNQYDKDSTYPDVKIEKTIEIDPTNGSTEILGANAGEAITVKGNNGTLKVEGAAIETNGGDLNVTDLTIEAGTPDDYAVIISDGTASFKNVTIKSAGGGVGVPNGAKVDFEGNVDVSTASTSGRYNFYVVGDGSELTINGGEFTFSKTLNQKRAYIYVDSGATVYVKGGNFGPASTRSGYTKGIMGDGTVIITGGTFGFNPSAWVPTGYVVTQNGSTWTVSAE